ncbi:M15 family metallopeptidase [Lysobacter sp. ESA13C]|uniref:M15 family metallopeptidase n=1 Tax=Lysobacter sp. ESA13C TaxID=2862676 RepID=UPI001CBBB7E9|nr:M15 family metallopeptidase [Lysobacter sp. ESA13C]
MSLVLVLSACAAAPPLTPRPKPQSVAPTLSSATDAVAAGMVEIRSLVPDISLDIRYAGADNFVGRPVKGYEAAGCYLHEPVAHALARVERSLRPQGLMLRIYDCYRPVRAVQDFVAWAGDLDDQRSKPQYYPNLDKRVLLGDYISPTSGHSRGATLDLGLLELREDRFEPLDMGTPFDFFDETAHTASPKVSAKQRSNRELLRSAMRREGFENYPLEWWHYTYKPEPTPQTAFDFPVR